jgi:hypothetical protein
MESQLCTESGKNRRPFIGGFRGMLTGSDEACLVGREKRWEDEPEAEDRSAKPHRFQPCGRAALKPTASPVCAAHAEFVATLSGHPPRTIPLEADAIDLEDRADHLSQVLSALSVYVAVILDDTAQNVPGSLDLRDAEGLLADLASEVTGAIQRAADDMAGGVA